MDLLSQNLNCQFQGCGNSIRIFSSGLGHIRAPAAASADFFGDGLDQVAGMSSGLLGFLRGHRHLSLVRAGEAGG